MRHTDPATGLSILTTRDENLTPFARKLMTNFYLRDDESPQEGYARAANAWSGGDKALAQRLYEYVSKGWFMFASPVLSNAPLPGEKAKNMPISCFLTYTPDSIDGLNSHTVETRWLSVLGGGVGGHWSDVRSVSKKAPGPIPFLHTMNADMDAYAQGVTRKGSYAAYLDVSHPDILEFISIRMVGADANRACFSKGFHHGVNITDAFMEAVENDLPWDLIDPHDKTVRETVRARMLWEKILEVRYHMGEPYLNFIDAANRALPESQKKLGLKIHGSNLCNEIHLATAADRTAVCCLSSLNAETYDEWKDTTIVADLITMLDNVLEFFIQNAPAPLERAAYSAQRERALGLGMMGFHAYLQKKNVAFESETARQINRDMFMKIKVEAVLASHKLALDRGEPEDMRGTGMRNSHLLALAPNANSGMMLATSPSIEPAAANAYVQESRAGNWQVKNRYLEALLKNLGCDDAETWRSIITNKGSVQHLRILTDHQRDVFKTAIEIDQYWVVQHAADRQPYICQGQSVNLFFPARASRAEFNTVHMQAWKQGLKGLYYLRSMAHSRPDAVSNKIDRVALTDAVPDSIEQEDCEACQG